MSGAPIHMAQIFYTDTDGYRHFIQASRQIEKYLNVANTYVIACGGIANFLTASMCNYILREVFWE